MHGALLGITNRGAELTKVQADAVDALYAANRVAFRSLREVTKHSELVDLMDPPFQKWEAFWHTLGVEPKAE
jgi:hypothetical protein